MPGPEPWERQPGETSRQFEAFVAYRDAPLTGKRRVLVDVARALELSVPRTEGWARRNGWVDRAAYWDDEQDRIWRNSVIRERHRVAQRHATMARALQAKALAALNLLQPSDLSPAEIVAMIRQARDMELAVYGRLVEPEDELGVVSGTTIVVPSELVPSSDVDPEVEEPDAGGPGLRAVR